MSITIIIIIATVAISLLAMNNETLLNKCILHPYSMAKDPSQWYRAITCGFIHADIPHLAFNMFSFYMFGEFIENDNELSFDTIFGNNGHTLFILLYISALVICIIPTYFSHKKKFNYYSLGASGAVSAIVFVGIFLQPTMKIGFFVIPPVIPGFLFGPLYLGLTVYLSKKGGGNINHSAHLWGSLYGIGFLIVAAKIFGMKGQPDLIDSFLVQVRTYLGM
jgi:membrane associated rhomboid family serine protease